MTKEERINGEQIIIDISSEVYRVWLSIRTTSWGRVAY